MALDNVTLPAWKHSLFMIAVMLHVMGFVILDLIKYLNMKIDPS